MYIALQPGLGQSVRDITRVLRLLSQRHPAKLFGFEFDKDVLTDDLRSKVDQFAGFVVASWQSAKPVRSIVLVGHTDDKGGNAYNNALGLRRANSVRSRLLVALDARQPGLTKTVKIDTVTRGEKQPVIRRRSRSARKRNRRVEVFITRIATKKPTPPKPQPRFSTRVPESTRRKILDTDLKRQEQEFVRGKVPSSSSRGKSIREKARNKFDRELRSAGVSASDRNRVIKYAEKGAWWLVKILLERTGLSPEARDAFYNSLQATYAYRF